MNPKDISIQDYGYELPEEKIAKYPLPNRDQSKLLVYKNGQITDSQFCNLSDFLPENALLVFNDTKVIHARLLFQKQSGALIEVFCLEPASGDYLKAFESTQNCVWNCLIGNAKRWKGEILEKDIIIDKKNIRLYAKLILHAKDSYRVEFSWNSPITFGELLHHSGILPLPPYLNRIPEEKDEIVYQTVYARENGSVAAPTAGLHFTPEMLNQLKNKNINRTELTLHIGAGTFKPVKSIKMSGHDMHRECVFVSLNSLEILLECLQNKRQIIPIGTTSLRSIESIYWVGVKLILQKNDLKQNPESVFEINQWESYHLPQNIDATHAVQAVIDYMRINNLPNISGYTKILIAPGYLLKLANALVTNFHQPNSTLLLLIASLLGEDWRKIYHHAISNNYRFLSFGDSNLLFNHST